MKQKKTPEESLTVLSYYIIDVYNSSKIKEKSKIQFELAYGNRKILCYIVGDGNKLTFNFGEIEDFDVKIISSFKDWFALANNKLKPAWGVITGKLKFIGDTNVFRRLLENDNMYEIQKLPQDPPTLFEKNPFKNWQKPKKVLVINSSPRGENGFTYHYLSHFITGMKKAGADVAEINLSGKNVKPCAGCFHCWKNNTGKCIQKDDVNDLYKIFYESDLIVYAFPLYWDTVPGILKNFIERGFCLAYPYMLNGLYKTRHPRREKSNKTCFVFSVCGFPENVHFNSVKHYFKAISHNSHNPFIGGIYRSACMFLMNNPLYHDIYEQVIDSMEKAGESIYNNGKINRSIIKKIQIKIKPKEFISSTNKFWENVILKKDHFVNNV